MSELTTVKNLPIVRAIRCPEKKRYVPLAEYCVTCQHYGGVYVSEDTVRCRYG